MTRVNLLVSLVILVMLLSLPAVALASTDFMQQSEQQTVSVLDVVDLGDLVTTNQATAAVTGTAVFSGFTATDHQQDVSITIDFISDTTVTVTGTGYPVNNTKTGVDSSPSVTIIYIVNGTARTVVTLTPDAWGNISTFTVPPNTDISSTNSAQAKFTILIGEYTTTERQAANSAIVVTGMAFRHDTTAFNSKTSGGRGNLPPLVLRCTSCRY